MASGLLVALTTLRRPNPQSCLGARAGIPGILVRFDTREKHSASRFLTHHLQGQLIPARESAGVTWEGV